MWFKQIQIFKLINFNKVNLNKYFTEQAFQPCPPSFPFSFGWTQPVQADEEEVFIKEINGYLIFCLRIEEKLLPATVIRHEVEKKVKEIETAEARKVYRKEKNNLRDEITLTLTTRAFSRYTDIFAYIDLSTQQLIVNSSNDKKVEQLINLFKKTTQADVKAYETKHIPSILTSWLTQQTNPISLSIEKSCMLQDVNEKNRVIRCQHQNLQADSIKAIITSGCEVRKIALMWQDQLQFTLNENLSLQSIRYPDELLNASKEVEAETELQVFHANFFIMTSTLSKLFNDLLSALNITDDVAEVAA